MEQLEKLSTLSLESMNILFILTSVTLNLFPQVSATNINPCTTMSEANQSVRPESGIVKLNERQSKNFWSKVDKNGPLPDQLNQKYKGLSQCWNWTASHIRGYGQFVYNYKMVKAHRLSYMMHIGPIPNGMLACHRCDNPFCVNPEHLWLGTNQENTSDRDAKGRSVKGEKSPHSKLTKEQVVEMREMHKSNLWNYPQLAEIFGVSQTLAKMVVKRKAWKHI